MKRFLGALVTFRDDAGNLADGPILRIDGNVLLVRDRRTGTEYTRHIDQLVANKSAVAKAFRKWRPR